MGLKSEGKHFQSYYDHVLNRKQATGKIAIVYNLIHDISDRRGLKWEWDKIDADVQDDIIETWLGIVSGKEDGNG